MLFIKDIVGASQPVLVWAVVTAWSLWAVSIASVVLSYFFSRIALRKAIEQVDRDDFSGGVGGRATSVTHFLNWLSGLLFILGIVFLIIFAGNNIGEKTMGDKDGSSKIEKGYVPPPPAPKEPEPRTECIIPPPPPPRPKAPPESEGK